MKKLEYILLGLLVSFAMGACSSDDENAGVIDPVFPESQSYEIIPEQVCEISFEASTEWRVTTDKQWLKFIDETGKFQSLTGKAGKQTVKVTVTDGALGFTGDKALVKLTMGDKTQTIAEMKRAAKERSVQMYTMVDNEIIEIDELVDNAFGRTKTIGFKANFDWKIDVESFPEWLINAGSEKNDFEHLCGEAGQAVNLKPMALLVTKLEERYQDLSGYITIRAIDSDFSYQFPVKATGIEATKIQWLGSNALAGSNLVWDDKGNRLIKKPNENEMTESDAPAMCHALIRDNDFACKFVEWDANEKEAKEVAAEDSWVEIAKKEGGILTLQAKKNEVRGSRKMVLFLIPKDATVDYNSQFDERGNFIFDKSGYGMQLDQYGLSGGFETWKQINSMKFDAMTNVTEVSNASEIAEKLHLETADNIYERSFTAEEWNMSNRIHIKPLGLYKTWWFNIEYFNSRFESLGNMPTNWATRAWSKSTVLDESYKDYPTLSLTDRIPFDNITDNCLYVVIRDNNNKDLGTFVIRKKDEATIK